MLDLKENGETGRSLSFHERETRGFCTSPGGRSQVWGARQMSCLLFLCSTFSLLSGPASSDRPGAHTRGLDSTVVTEQRCRDTSDTSPNRKEDAGRQSRKTALFSKLWQFFTENKVLTK